MGDVRLDTVLDTLDALEYADVDSVEAALGQGLEAVSLRNVFAHLAQMCARAVRIDIVVSAQEDGDDPDLFVIELASFLKEYGCPLPEFQHDIRTALAVPENRLRLLEFLTSEACACKFLQKQESARADSDSLTSSTPTQHLTCIIDTLRIPRSAGQSTTDIFKAVEAKILSLAAEVGKDYIPDPLLKKKLSREQWQKLEEINRALAEEYSVRRQMLLKRLDVTVQSFKWSDRGKSLLDKIEGTFQPKRKLLTSASSVDCSDILFAGTDLTMVMKTSNSAVRQNTQTSLAKILIGNVPDRGGRTSESRPPPEMPRFRARTSAGAKEQRDRGGDRGGRVQGGWKQDGGRGGGSGGGGHGKRGGGGGARGGGGGSQGWGRKVVTD